MIFVKERPPTELCEIGAKYHTNKSLVWGDHYTLLYYDLFNARRDEIKKVMEFGIGYPDWMPIKGYQTGASLFMWRDFFPNAMVYGADIEPSCMFKAERIRTFLVDEWNQRDLEQLIERTGSDIDVFVDDALHDERSQIFLLDHMMPLLNKGVTYLIEDVPNATAIEAHLRETPYAWERVRFQHKRANFERVYIVRHS